MFGDLEIQDALRTTLKVAAQVTVVSVLIGTAAAFPLVRGRLRFAGGLRVTMTLPIMIPGILIGISLLILYTQVLHVPLSPRTAVIGQSLYTIPFVLLLVAARLQGFDRNLERAASDLGANTFNRLRLVVLPLIFPAILAGALFAFTLSFDEFVITYFIIGNANTLPIYIYTQIKFGDLAGGERPRGARPDHVDPAHLTRIHPAGRVPAGKAQRPVTAAYAGGRGSRSSGRDRLGTRGNRLAAFGGGEEQLQGSRLADRICPAEERLRLAGDRVGEVLQLQLVGIGRVEADLLRAGVRLHHDPGCRPAVPGIVEGEQPRTPLQLELVRLEHVEARRDLGEHSAREGHRARKANVDAGVVPDRLAVDALGLAGEVTGCVHAVAAHVHQRASVELGQEPDVQRVVGGEAVHGPDQPELADRPFVRPAPRARRICG